MNTRSRSTALPDAKRHKGEHREPDMQPEGLTDFVPQGRTVAEGSMSLVTPPATPYERRGRGAQPFASSSSMASSLTDMSAYEHISDDDAGTPPPLEPAQLPLSENDVAVVTSRSESQIFAPTGVARNLLEAFHASAPLVPHSEVQVPQTDVVDAQSTDVQIAVVESPLIVADVGASTVASAETDSSTASASVPVHPPTPSSGSPPTPSASAPSGASTGAPVLVATVTTTPNAPATSPTPAVVPSTTGLPTAVDTNAVQAVTATIPSTANFTGTIGTSLPVPTTTTGPATTTSPVVSAVTAPDANSAQVVPATVIATTPPAPTSTIATPAGALTTTAPVHAAPTVPVNTALSTVVANTTPATPPAAGAAQTALAALLAGPPAFVNAVPGQHPFHVPTTPHVTQPPVANVVPAVAQAAPAHGNVQAAVATHVVLAPPVVGALPAPVFPANPLPAAVVPAIPAPGPVVAAGQNVPDMAMVRALFAGLERVPDDVLLRLYGIVHVAIPNHNLFAVHRVPSTADWGRGRNERLLCLNDVPLTIWLAARATSLWFFSRGGEPHPRVNIGFIMAAARDYEAVKLLYQRARPRSAPPSETVYASRLQTVRDRGEQIAHAVAFDEVYDATENLTVKSAMRRINAADLADDDIVLVEAMFTRWKKPIDKKKKNWPSWDVGFELQAISLIYSPPAVVEDSSSGVQAVGPVFSF